MGDFVARHLQIIEPLYTREEFRVEHFITYLYTHMTNELARMELLGECESIVNKLQFVSRMLNTLYNGLYYMNIELNQRYCDMVPYMHTDIAQIHQILRNNIQYQDQRREPTRAHVVITPYMLISPKSKKLLHDCPVCYNPIDYCEQIQLQCGHKTCYSCFTQHVHSSAPNTPKCVLCRHTIGKLYTTNPQYYAEWETRNQRE